MNGPRQSGKSELLKMLAASTGGTYATLDDSADLRSARTDPSGFLERLSRPFLIDEVQRGGDPLILAVKRRLDESRDRGAVRPRRLDALSAVTVTQRDVRELFAGFDGCAMAPEIASSAARSFTSAIAYEASATGCSRCRSRPCGRRRRRRS